MQEKGDIPKRKPPKETVAAMSHVTLPVSVCSMESSSSKFCAVASICTASAESLSFDSDCFESPSAARNSFDGIGNTEGRPSMESQVK